ncbi:MAG TPA: NACHT domain-containing NTPase [Oculatellaceae cyanobacterium]|jgi:predicted NACHT family NTPase
MAKRSLKASPSGIEKAKNAFKCTGWTQDNLAEQVGITTRQSIWKFFSGKSVERQIFIEICFQMNLDWQEIADLPRNTPVVISQPKQDQELDIESLVQKLRSQCYDKIADQCSTMRLLDVAHPLQLNDIYVNVNILEFLSSQQWLDVSDLHNFNQEKFNRLGLSQYQQRIPGLEAIANSTKVMVFGKPGSGKTTFLQKIALLCNQGEFQPHQVPIFIRLRNFAADLDLVKSTNLLDYIYQQIGSTNLKCSQVQTLLEHGRAIILLDGLDEVPTTESDEVLQQIRKFCNHYYKNHFIISCRIAAKQYQFEGFTDIEIADFDFTQIEAFAKKWFVAVGKNIELGLAKATQFIEKLELPQNLQIKELATTPLLLNLTCLVFQAKTDFPARRSELYKQGLDLLLTRWDESRGIKRDEIYHNLSLLQKLKLLSQIAAITFEQHHYFIEQNTIEYHITTYLKSLLIPKLDEDELQLHSAAVLKSIEVQHGLLVERSRGIYSFSHLTFQEYLTARNIVANLEPEILNQNLNKLVSHITEPRWREVFLLTAGLLGNADQLLQLMKQKLDQMLAEDKQLQQFLSWLNQKSESVIVNYQPAAIRAFYITLALAQNSHTPPNLNLAIALDLSLAGNLTPELKLDLALDRLLRLSLSLPENPTIDRVLDLGFALPIQADIQCIAVRSPLQKALHNLKIQLTQLDGAENLASWWQANGSSWTEELRTAMIRYRNIGQNWHFSLQQQQMLQQYYQANQFLLSCLNNNCQVSPHLRAEILQTLLLPISETPPNPHNLIGVPTLTASTGI